MPKPIRETRVLKLVFITILCLKFWAQQYGNSTTKWPFYTFFLVNSSLYILFSMVRVRSFMTTSRNVDIISI